MRTRAKGSRAPRDARIDALRGLAILLVVLGHAAFVPFAHSAPGAGLVALGGAWVERSVAEGYAFNIAYSVHMPLFAFVAGYVLWGRDHGSVPKTVGHRALQLMVPFVMWVGAAAVIYRTPLASLPATLGTALIYPQTGGAPWFLYALFGSFCLFAVLRALSRGEGILAASAVIVGLVSVVPATRVGDVFGVYEIAWLYPFLVLGYLTPQRHDRILEHRTRVLLVSALAYVALLVALWPVMTPDLGSWYPGLREAMHAIGLPGAYVLLQLVKYGCAAAGIGLIYVLSTYVHRRVLAPFAWLGTRTLGIYVSHRFIVEAVSRYTDSIAVVFAVSVAGAVVVTLLLEQWWPLKAVFLGGPWHRSAAAAPSRAER